MIKNGIIQEDNIYGIPFKVDLIPVGRSGRPQEKMAVDYITVHNTGNNQKGADAKMHNNYVHKEIGKVSWHFSIDDNIIYQELPITEIALHAGDGHGDGNRKSVGVEICEVGNWKKSRENALKLIKYLMLNVESLKGDNITKTIVPHQHWSGKYCPRIILAEPKGFAGFISDLKDIMKPAENKDLDFKEACTIIGKSNPKITVSPEFWETNYKKDENVIKLIKNMAIYINSKK